MRVFVNEVLRNINGNEVEEDKGEWTALHKEGLHDLYCCQNIVRVNRWWMMR
jgi:hypothetical protein